MSVLPVWRPERDQVVSPWRIMKTRGVVILLGLLSLLYSGGSGGVCFLFFWFRRRCRCFWWLWLWWVGTW